MVLLIFEERPVYITLKITVTYQKFANVIWIVLKNVDFSIVMNLLVVNGNNGILSIL